jgi:hypothetical protein
MKRSEIIEHIAAEMVDAAASRKYSNETEQAYYKRKASGILDMLLGFGMEPPSKCDTGKCSEIGCGNEWEAEDEEK